MPSDKNGSEDPSDEEQKGSKLVDDEAELSENDDGFQDSSEEDEDSEPDEEDKNFIADEEEDEDEGDRESDSDSKDERRKKDATTRSSDQINSDIDELQDEVEETEEQDLEELQRKRELKKKKHEISKKLEVLDLIDDSRPAPDIGRRLKKKRTRQEVEEDALAEEELHVEEEEEEEEEEEDYGYLDYSEEGSRYFAQIGLAGYVPFNEMIGDAELDSLDSSIGSIEEPHIDFDIPERLVYRQLDVLSVSPSELQLEADWIAHRLYPSYFRDSDSDSHHRHHHHHQSEEHMQKKAGLLKAIESVLQLMNMNYEIPFIYMFKTDSFDPHLRDMESLWDISDHDEQWFRFRKLQKRVQSLIKDDESLASLNNLMLENSYSEALLSDILHYINVVEAKDASSLPRFSALVGDKGINTVAEAFEISINDLVESLPFSINYDSSSPLDLASNNISASGGLSKAEKVLSAARYILSVKIGLHPRVRQKMRDYLRKGKFEELLISTKLTANGVQVLHENHCFWPYAFLEKQPLSCLLETRNCFSLMLKAEAQGLIHVTLAAKSLEETVQKMYDMVKSTGTSSVSSEWNKQRALVLDDAIKKIVVPQILEEVYKEVVESEKKKISHRIYKKMQQILMQRPRTSTKTNICAMVASERHVSVGTVDENSNLVEFCSFNSFFERNPLRQKWQEADRQELVKFLRRSQSSVFLVAANCPLAKELHEFLMSELKDEERERERVFFVDPSIARSAASTPIVEKEFPESSLEKREIVMLASFYHDPITPMGIIFQSGPDYVVSFAIDQHQVVIGKKEQIKWTLRSAMYTVAKVGVNFSELLSHQFRHTVLQFVAGIGKQTANYLYEKIQKMKEPIESRVALSDLLLSTVRTNAIGFFSFKHSKEDHWCCTRIHPDDYRFADTFMRNIDLRSEAFFKESEEERRRKLNDYFQDFPESQQQNLKIKRIKEELISPYKDPRQSYQQPGEKDLFSCLFHESDETLFTGMRVSVVVTKPTKETEEYLRIKKNYELPLVGFLESGVLCDLHSLSPKMRLKANSCITAIVEKIDFNMPLVTLVDDDDDNDNDGGGKSRSSVQHKKELEKIFGLTSSFTAHISLERMMNSVLIANGEPDPKKQRTQNSTTSTSGKVIPRLAARRTYFHPLFKNIGYRQAEEELTAKELGAKLFRPSSQRSNCIILSIKFHSKVFHIEIKEKEKGVGFSLQNQDYEDLNEILARFVDNIVLYARKMSANRKFINNSQDIGKKLENLKRERPRQIPYFIIEHPSRPLAYEIVFQTSNIHRVPILLTPDGYRYKRKPSISEVFRNPEEVFEFWKKSFHDTQQQKQVQHQQQKQVQQQQQQQKQVQQQQQQELQYQHQYQYQHQPQYQYQPVDAYSQQQNYFQSPHDPHPHQIYYPPAHDPYLQQHPQHPSQNFPLAFQGLSTNDPTAFSQELQQPSASYGHPHNPIHRR